MTNSQQKILWDSLTHVKIASTIPDGHRLSELFVGKDVDDDDIVISPATYQLQQRKPGVKPPYLRALTPRECYMLDCLMGVNIIDTLDIDWASMYRCVDNTSPNAIKLSGIDTTKKYLINIASNTAVHDMVVSVYSSDGVVIAIRSPTDAEIPIIAALFKTLLA